MLEKHSNLLSQNMRLGNALKQIRLSKKLRTIDVSTALGFKYKSSYCLIEQGKTTTICIWTILKICKILGCNIVYLFILADINIFETEIKTWAEFFAPIQKLFDADIGQKTTNKNLLSFSDNQRLGIALKQIRISKNLKTINVSKYLDYDAESSYTRIEQGKTESICVWTVLKICKLFECNIVQLFALVGFDIFETEIKTWIEFFHLQQNISEVDLVRIKKLINLAPPYKINRLKLAA